jgi:hypothetical protein
MSKQGGWVKENLFVTVRINLRACVMRACVVRVYVLARARACV